MSTQSVSGLSLTVYSMLMKTRPAPLAVLLKRLFLIRRRNVTSPFGTFYVDPVTVFGMKLIQRRPHEPSMIETVRGLLCQGSVFVDLGAHEGFFSIVAAAVVGETGKVYAVEPQDRIRPVMQRNFEKNHVWNAVILPYAVADTSGSDILLLSPNTTPGSTSLIRTTRYPLRTQTVETLTLEELFARHGIERCDLLKIDIEGSEYEAVLGSRPLFEQRRVAAVALELHPDILRRRGKDPDEIVGFLLDCGYQVDARFSNLVLTTREGGRG